MVPNTKNQLSAWREIESLVAFWFAKGGPPFSPPPQPASLVASNVTQDKDIDVVEEFTVQTATLNSEGSKFSSRGVPPSPVKMIKRDKNIFKNQKWQI